MTHIMLDLETWGTRPGCDIRSIGAVVFDPVAGTLPFTDEGRFYVATENPLVEGYMGVHKYFLTRDPETMKWWNSQSAEAQSAFTNAIDVRDACQQFNDWLLSQPTDLKIWANDPHFDVSIIEHVYHAVGIDYVWHYRAPRSIRTVCELAGMQREDFKAFEHGTAHNALDDAISQAMIVCEAYKRLGLQK